MGKAICENCGNEYAIGEWPFCPHGMVTKNPQQELTHYYDMGLDAEITSRGHRRQLERELGVDARDFKSKGEENDRRDRCRELRELRDKERPSGRIYSR